MMAMRPPILIGLLLLMGCTSRIQPQADLVIVAPRLLDVARGEVLRDQAVIIRDGTISAVESAGRRRHVAARSLRLSEDLTLLPGFIDAHVHLAWDGVPSDEAARVTLLAGFTTVRNPGSSGNADLALREAIESGSMAGPRMLIARTGIGAPGGVCERTFGAPGVVNADAARERVAQLITDGAQLIKICTGGDVYGRPADIDNVEMSAETVAAIVEEAHRRGVRVAAHAQGPRAIRVAAQAGVDSIEHGSLIDAGAAALLAAKGIVLVPTLARLDTALEAARGRNAAPDAIVRLETLRNETYARIRAAHTRGVQVVFGTDGGVLPHGRNAREFRALAEIGLSPLEAIRAATIDAAKLIGWEGHVGEIAPGRFADLVAVCGDPLASAAAVDVALVIARGRVVLDETAKCAQRSGGQVAPTSDRRPSP